MQERKRKKLLRAAVALSLLGAMAMPVEVGAVYPYSDRYTNYIYDSPFNWPYVNNTPVDVGISFGGSLDSKYPAVKLCSGFVAYNSDSVGKKEITHFYRTNLRLPELKSECNEWERVNSIEYKRTGSDEISLNGLKLRNTQEHWVILESNEDNSHSLYYEIKEASDSSLSFDDNGIKWKTGNTLLAFWSKFDLGTNGLSIDMVL